MTKILLALGWLIAWVVIPITINDLLWHFRFYSYEPNTILTGTVGFIIGLSIVLKTWDK
jgi:hypothetical protein